MSLFVETSKSIPSVVAVVPAPVTKDPSQDKTQAAVAATYPALSVSYQYRDVSAEDLAALDDLLVEDSSPVAQEERPVAKVHPLLQEIMAIQWEVNQRKEAIKRTGVEPAEMRRLGGEINDFAKRWENKLIEYREIADPEFFKLLEDALKAETRRTLSPSKSMLLAQEIEAAKKQFQLSQKAFHDAPSMSEKREIVQRSQALIADWQSKILEYRKIGNPHIIGGLEQDFFKITNRTLPAETSSYPTVDTRPVVEDTAIASTIQRGKEIEAMKARKAAKMPVELREAISLATSKPACDDSFAMPPEPDLRPYPILDSAPSAPSKNPLDIVLADIQKREKDIERNTQAVFDRRMRKAEGQETLADKLREKSGIADALLRAFGNP